MKTSLAPTPDRFQKIGDAPRTAGPVTDYSYKSPVPPASATSGATPKTQAQLTNFRALNRKFFGAEAGREYLKEAIVFGSMMIVAAWPLGITYHMLSTMMISPPPWIINGVLRYIG
jgi:hypothetical protein